MTRSGGASGIVLAGGAASRFGSPKLAASLDGRPLLDHALDAVEAVCAEIVLVVEPGASPVLRPRSVPVRIVTDPDAFPGPRAALLHALAAVMHPLAVVVGGDMPWLRPAFLDALLDRLAADERSAAAPILYGMLRPLPCAVRVAAVARVALPRHGSLLALLEAVGVAPLPEPTWRAVDPDGVSLQDVDRPEDLAGPLALPVRGWSATWSRPTIEPADPALDARP